MSLANWRDLSVVLLAIEVFVISLVPGIILFFCVKGMLWMIRKIRGVAPVIQGYFRKAEQVSRIASERVAAPFIAASAAAAQVRRWQHSLISSPRSKEEV